jgi:hypothetical protein
MKTWHQVDIKPVTIESPPSADQAVADAIRSSIRSDQASLARQLANDEPKCANCKNWRQLSPRGQPFFLGECLFALIIAAAVDHNNNLAEQGHDCSVGEPFDPPLTTDLSVCSRWEPKG